MSKEEFIYLGVAVIAGIYLVRSTAAAAVEVVGEVHESAVNNTTDFFAWFTGLDDEQNAMLEN